MDCEKRACKIGIYTRQSRDENGENLETIETQRDLVIEYIKKNSLGEIVQVYLDDNFSGSNFNRQGIEKLEKDVIEGKIDLLVMKDLSRLGRNNAKTLLFLDFLEEYGIRVLTVDGRYDSQRDNDTVGIDTWYNERYIRDISKKIRANLRHKIEKGEYIGHAPYGYEKSKVQKNKLIVNENSARVVRDIFKLYLSGLGYKKIASYLNEKGIPPPLHNKYAVLSGMWNHISIKRILLNRVYIGDTVQGVSEKISFKNKKTRKKPSENWVITLNTHEAIINQDDFLRVKTLMDSKKKLNSSYKGSIHIFKNLLFCGKCSEPMVARKRIGRPMGYICGSYAKYGKKTCSSHYVREDVLYRQIAEELITLLHNDDIREKSFKFIENNILKLNDYDRELNRLKKEKEDTLRQQDLLYLDRLEARISKEQFERINSLFEERINLINSEIQNASTLAQKQDANKFFEQIVNNVIDKKLENEMVKTFIDKIIVYENDDTKNFEKYSIPESENPKGIVLMKFKFHK